MGPGVIQTIHDLQTAEQVMLHDLAFAGLHTNVEVASCVCSNVVKVLPPNFTGETCSNCGAMAVRTGTCTTCTNCASTGGCG